METYSESYHRCNDALHDSGIGRCDITRRAGVGPSVVAHYEHARAETFDAVCSVLRAQHEIAREAGLATYTALDQIAADVGAQIVLVPRGKASPHTHRAAASRVNLGAATLVATLEDALADGVLEPHEAEDLIAELASIQLRCGAMIARLRPVADGRSEVVDARASA